MKVRKLNDKLESEEELLKHVLFANTMEPRDTVTLSMDFIQSGKLFDTMTSLTEKFLDGKLIY